MTIDVRKLGGALGAEIGGLDLSRPLPEEARVGLRHLLAEHLVLLFRAQSLPARAQIAFTEIFGPVTPHALPTHRDSEHPELLVLENRPGQPGRRNDFWHTDVTFSETPAAASVLYAVEVPDGRGDTLFCNMIAAHEALSAGLKALLRPLSALHSAEPEIRNRHIGVTAAVIAAKTPPPVTHPVVRTHPITGRDCLFINPYFTQRFVDMTVEESRPLIELLASAATRPENVYRHRWQAGDLVAWDNRTTMHYAVHDYDETAVRRMRRSTAQGEVPFLADRQTSPAASRGS